MCFKNLGSLIFEKLEHRNIEKQAVLVDKRQIDKVVGVVWGYKHSSKYQVFDSIEGVFCWLKIPVAQKELVKENLKYILLVILGVWLKPLKRCNCDCGPKFSAVWNFVPTAGMASIKEILPKG